MILLDGKKTAEQLNIQLKEKISTLEPKPRLDIILVGDDPASLIYVRNKVKSAASLGIIAQLHHLDSMISDSQLTSLIEKLNNDNSVDGILLQLPIPKHLDSNKFINLIDASKDVDGFHVINQGKLFQKREGIKPATPQGIIMLLEHYKIDVTGLNAVVIGRSQIVGAPIAKMLLDLNASVTIVHSKTKDIKQYTKMADLIVVAIGKAKFLTKDMVKDGVIVIDVGINKVDGKLVGDADFDEISKVASYITPVPKGVGPMTICAITYNLLKLYKMNHG